MTKKYLIVAVIAAIAAGGIFGGYKYLLAPKVVATSASPAGSTGRSAFQFNSYGNNLSAPGTNGTSTSILNNTGQDLYVSGEYAGCEGVGTSKAAYTGAGLASLTVTAATSSTAAPASNSNTNTLPVITIATSTPQYTLASSTAAFTGSGSVSLLWLAGSYMTFTVNATNTAICTFGVSAFSA